MFSLSLKELRLISKNRNISYERVPKDRLSIIIIMEADRAFLN